MNKHLLKCTKIFESMMHLFKMTWKQICSIEDLRKVIELFPPGCADFKMSDFNGVMAELKMLDYQCTDKKLDGLTQIFKLSEDYKTYLPNANKLCRLVFTT